jgi:hypothetical protein
VRVSNDSGVQSVESNIHPRSYWIYDVEDREPRAAAKRQINSRFGIVVVEILHGALASV